MNLGALPSILEGGGFDFSSINSLQPISSSHLNGTHNVIDIQCTSVLFSRVFANQNPCRPPILGFLGEVPTGSESASLAPAALPPPHSRLPRPCRGSARRHTPRRDENPAPASPFQSPLTKAVRHRDAVTPLDSAFAKMTGCRHLLPPCPTCNAPKRLAHPPFFSITCAMPLPQLLSSDNHPFSWGVYGVLAVAFLKNHLKLSHIYPEGKNLPLVICPPFPFRSSQSCFPFHGPRSPFLPRFPISLLRYLLTSSSFLTSSARLSPFRPIAAGAAWCHNDQRHEILPRLGETSAPSPVSKDSERTSGSAAFDAEPRSKIPEPLGSED